MLINRIRMFTINKNIIPWLNNLTNNGIIKEILDVLFKPNPRVETDVTHFRETYNATNRILVCSHIRTTKNPSNPNDNFVRKCNTTVAFEFLDRFNNSEKYAIYISSDSDKVKQDAKIRLKNVICLDREIVHIDRIHKNVKEVCEGFNTAVYEQTLLSRCDVLMLSISGFSKMAAALRGRSENLFTYDETLNRIRSLNLTELLFKEA